MTGRKWALVVASLAFAMLGSTCGSEPAPPQTQPAQGGAPNPFQSVPAYNGPDLPKCKYPKPIEAADWVPDDLPLPSGTYRYDSFKPLRGFSRGLFVLKMGTEQFGRYILKEWPNAGWILGRGDSEPGELEDAFSRPPSAGAFRANDVFCAPGYSVMYLIYSEQGQGSVPVPTPTSTGTPLNPNAGN